MPLVAMKNVKGKDAGQAELSDEIFGVQPNVPLMHQVVTAQLARRRAGTQSTKTRAEVSGGGKKPFKQKGTGNARQGSTRAPHFSGGGVALGPKPRKYGQKTPKKMIKGALHSALSDRANEGKILVVDSWNLTAPSTKAAAAALKALDLTGSVLIVHNRNDIAAIKSFRNIPSVQLLEVSELNAYDVLCNQTIVFSKDTLPAGEGAEAEAASAPKAAKPKVAKAKAADAEVAEVAVAEVAPVAAVGKSGVEADPAAEADAAPYGEGSHAPLADGSQPEGYSIKGNADSMLYHVEGTRYYKATVAEVWFATAEAAEAAGFSEPGSKKAADDKEES